jgi:hypothetical protein
MNPTVLTIFGPAVIDANPLRQGLSLHFSLWSLPYQYGRAFLFTTNSQALAPGSQRKGEEPQKDATGARLSAGRPEHTPNCSLPPLPSLSLLPSVMETSPDKKVLRLNY